MTFAHAAPARSSSAAMGRRRKRHTELLHRGSLDNCHLCGRFNFLTIRDEHEALYRLTNAFSKKLENLQAALALHFAHYNLVRVHKTLRITPAMAANVTDRLWSLEELVEQTSK